MKKPFVILLFLLPFFCSAADAPVKYKKLQSEAKAALKAGKNQVAAEQKLLDAVGRPDITQAQRAEIYFLAQELERSQNEAENMKMYLKQTYDTTKFFSTILKMHDYLLACDSIESQPNEKGIVKLKYRARGREILKQYRNYVLNGGIYLLKREKYAEAYPYFDMYLKSARSAFFENYSDIRSESVLPRAAYWATLSAYNANEPRKVLKHIDEAIEGATDSVRVSLQEYKVRCYEVLNDSLQWQEELTKGNQLYPAHDYFYLHLMDIYIQNAMYDEGIALCDTMIEKVGERGIYWYGESQMYLGKQDYDNTIRTADEALKLDTTLTNAYYNKGMAYLNKAVLYGETACNDVRNPKCKEERSELMSLYRSAQQPLEELRRRHPQDSKRWASPLYRIYLNLNMGKEFAEMEQILNAQ